MSDQMIGVVLWADAHDRKAVIWCEDHGNLAYYSASDRDAQESGTPEGDACLDAGDLIAFDMREERDCRLVRNPRRVNAGFAPGLARDLSTARPQTQGGGDNVVPFRPRRA